MNIFGAATGCYLFEGIQPGTIALSSNTFTSSNFPLPDTEVCVLFKGELIAGILLGIFTVTCVCYRSWFIDRAPSLS